MKHLKIHIVLLLCVAIFTLSQCKPEPKESNPPTSVGTPAPITPPVGFPAMNIPADNPQTVEGVELGRHLFYDKKLSADLTISCATCHEQFRAFSDVDQVSTGVNGKIGRRQAMALFNLVFQEEFFWDGRAQSLEEQSLHPIVDPVEMDNTLTVVISRLEADSAYPSMFKAAFGDTKINEERIGKAIAQFERTMISAK
ncbi:cytochrome-c peroxidase [Owenweeksia hongkongensis]|uniref:cytochrome-c peroxidase n=1 Tax=Owenweeksia hongkongensis TaxID=253245 RepID=UPI00145F48D4|nr:cytochrome-c peroxidase [Owenweeksia hongkongensis]